jgi:hypothetical protein
MSVKWYGDTVADHFTAKALDAGEEWLNLVKADAMEHCPVDQGTMRGTHTIQRESHEAVLGVGGPAAPYTAKQHDDASLHHTVGEDHWLEKAKDRQESKLNPLLEAKMG